MNKSAFCKIIRILLVLMLFPASTLRAQDTPSDMSDYRGQDGKFFLFYVTGDDSGQCYGGEDNIYTDDSPLAVAAVHAGLVKPNETKLVKVKVMAVVVADVLVEVLAHSYLKARAWTRCWLSYKDCMKQSC